MSKIFFRGDKLSCMILSVDQNLEILSGQKQVGIWRTVREGRGLGERGEINIETSYNIGPVFCNTYLS